MYAMIVLQTYNLNSKYFFIHNFLNNCQTNSLFINNTIWCAWLYELVNFKALFEIFTLLKLRHISGPIKRRKSQNKKIFQKNKEYLAP
jgi:hypothetical protein